MSGDGTIRITDLWEPELTEAQKAAIQGAESQPVELTEASVMEAARARTGLSDFGPQDFRERLSVWLQSLEEDTELNAVGRLGAWNDLIRYLANRLRFQDLVRRHPEVLEVEIDRPIIVAGLPRSGTTHLLNLIAADRRLRSLPYWESLEPIPDPSETPGPDGTDPRWARAQAAWEQLDTLLPLIRAMHPMPPDHIHEEIELQALDISSYLPEWTARVPRWRDYYLAHDQRPSYRYMKDVLRALQWQRGPDRWVLKSPQHLEQLGPLHETFPDATIVVTHRDPVAVIRSAITMLAYGDRVRRRRVDPGEVAEYWIDRVERLLRGCVADRERIPASQSIDVPFHKFMADDVAMVERIYECAGLPMTDEARRDLDDYMARNPRGKHGQVVYDLWNDFGIDPDRLRKRFDFYFERFDVAVED